MRTILLLLALTFSTVSMAGNWNYATPVASPITNDTAVTIKAAVQGNRNYITSLQVFNTHATVSTIVTVQKGSTVLWTGFVPAITAALPLTPLIITFPNPFSGDTNQALTFKANTTGANIYISAQGYEGRL